MTSLHLSFRPVRFEISLCLSLCTLTRKISSVFKRSAFYGVQEINTCWWSYTCIHTQTAYNQIDNTNIIRHLLFLYVGETGDHVSADNIRKRIWQAAQGSSLRRVAGKWQASPEQMQWKIDLTQIDTNYNVYTSTDHARNYILIYHLMWQVSQRRKGVGANKPDKLVTRDLSGIWI
jgi:hypothetical protein